MNGLNVMFLEDVVDAAAVKMNATRASVAGDGRFLDMLLEMLMQMFGDCNQNKSPEQMEQVGRRRGRAVKAEMTRRLRRLNQEDEVLTRRQFRNIHRNAINSLYEVAVESAEGDIAPTVMTAVV